MYLLRNAPISHKLYEMEPQDNINQIKDDLESDYDQSDDSKETSKGKKSAGRWTKEEHQKFVEALKLFGKNWKQVEEHVGTRTGAQIRSHAQKFFLRLQREAPATSNPTSSTVPLKDPTPIKPLIPSEENLPEILPKLPEEEKERPQPEVPQERMYQLLQRWQEVAQRMTSAQRPYHGSFYEVIMARFKQFRQESYSNLKLSDLVDLKITKERSVKVQGSFQRSRAGSLCEEEPRTEKKHREEQTD